MVFLKLRRQRASQSEILMKRLGPHSRVNFKVTQQITHNIQVAGCRVLRIALSCATTKCLGKFFSEKVTSILKTCFLVN